MTILEGRYYVHAGLSGYLLSGENRLPVKTSRLIISGASLSYAVDSCARVFFSSQGQRDGGTPYVFLAYGHFAYCLLRACQKLHSVLR